MLNQLKIHRDVEPGGHGVLNRWPRGAWMARFKDSGGGVDRISAGTSPLMS